MLKIKKILFFAFVAAVSLSLFGCESGATDKVEVEEPIYTVNYVDDVGSHVIEVRAGEIFSLESLPQKIGYDFIGLYNDQVGGVRIVDENGMSVTGFTFNRNIVLYPRFTAKIYDIILDYQGSPVTGIRSMSVPYGTAIDNLPTDLSVENKEFVGWYTAPDKKGIQIADKYGAVPTKNVVNEKNFDLGVPDGYIYLYAGFKGEERTVTLYFDDERAPETVRIEHGTSVSDIVTETRVNDKAVIAWSTVKNDTEKTNVFNGKITEDKTLYACEYAPVIDFDANGGADIPSIVKRAGESLSLPIAVKENYKFVGWKTAGGADFKAELMPSDSVKLFAAWQAVIVFEENGGTVVEDISQAQGTAVTLPETEKSGFMFAGWYDANGNKYTSAAMPAASIKLYAKYYKVLTVKKVVVDDATSISAYNIDNKPNLDKRCKVIDFSDIYENEEGGSTSSAGNYNDKNDVLVTVTIHYRADGRGASLSSPKNKYIVFYYTKSASDAYKFMSFSEEHTDKLYHDYQYTAKVYIKSDTAYMSWYTDNFNYDGDYYTHWTDIWLEIEYPDTSELY